jgi:hypothetical protein
MNPNRPNTLGNSNSNNSVINDENQSEEENALIQRLMMDPNELQSFHHIFPPLLRKVRWKIALRMSFDPKIFSFRSIQTFCFIA